MSYLRRWLTTENPTIWNFIEGLADQSSACDVARPICREGKRKLARGKSILRSTSIMVLFVPPVCCDKVVRAVADCGYFRSAGRQNKPSEKKASRWSNRLENVVLFGYKLYLFLVEFSFSWRYGDRNPPRSLLNGSDLLTLALIWAASFLFSNSFSLSPTTQSSLFLQLYVVQK